LSIGLVVPTRGDRPSYLVKALQSAKNSGADFVLLVCPRSFTELETFYDSKLIHGHIFESGPGAAGAIDLGIRSLPPQVKFASWLGDDDLLEVNGLTVLAECMKANASFSAAFGRCLFINEDGSTFGRSSLGSVASPLLRFGPDFIPQPASLFRVDSYKAVGGLKANLKYAFDLDLFIELSKVGKLKHVPEQVARYRWHNQSLSSANKLASRIESRQVRESHLPWALRGISFLWEVPMELSARFANSMDRKSRRHE
jgi:hypothetical protein